MNCDNCNKDDFGTGKVHSIRMYMEGIVFENKKATVNFYFCDINCLYEWIKKKVNK